MKCENCEACHNSSYEYPEYECILGVKEQEFADETIGCLLKSKTIKKRLEEHGAMLAEHYAGMADFMQESERKDNAMKKAMEEVFKSQKVNLCAKRSDGSFYEYNFESILKECAWEIRSKYEELLEDNLDQLIERNVEYD